MVAQQRVLGLDEQTRQRIVLGAQPELLGHDPLLVVEVGLRSGRGRASGRLRGEGSRDAASGGTSEMIHRLVGARGGVLIAARRT